MDNGALPSLGTRTSANKTVNNQHTNSENATHSNNTEEGKFSDALSNEMNDKAASGNEQQDTAGNTQPAKPTKLTTRTDTDAADVAVQAQAEQLQATLLSADFDLQAKVAETLQTSPHLVIDASKLATFNLEVASVQGQQQVTQNKQVLSAQLPLGEIQLAAKHAEQSIDTLDTQHISLQQTTGDEGNVEFALQDLLRQVASAKMVKSELSQSNTGIGMTQAKVDLQLNNPTMLLHSTPIDAHMRYQSDSGTIKVDIPVGNANWASSVFERAMMLTDSNANRSVQIQLNPPELGPLEVRIKVSSEGANVTFASHHGAVRDAIENALPRLRDMFAGQGINLADASVSDQPLNQQQQPEPGSQQQAEGTFDELAAETEDAVTINTAQLISALESGLTQQRVAVDYYA